MYIIKEKLIRVRIIPNVAATAMVLLNSFWDRTAFTFMHLTCFTSCIDHFARHEQQLSIITFLFRFLTLHKHWENTQN